MKIARDLEGRFPFAIPIRSELDTHTHFLFNLAGTIFFYSVSKILWLAIVIMLIADTIKEIVDQVGEDGWSWKDWFYNLNGISSGWLFIIWITEGFKANFSTIGYIIWIIFLLFGVPYFYEK